MVLFVDLRVCPCLCGRVQDRLANYMETFHLFLLVAITICLTHYRYPYDGAERVDAGLEDTTNGRGK